MSLPYRARRRAICRGFSAFDAVVAIALLAGILAVVFSLSRAVAQANARIALARRVGNAAQAAVGRFLSESRSANAVDLGASALGTHPGALALTVLDGLGVPHTHTIRLDGEALVFAVDGVAQGPLIAPSVSVDSLVFRRIVTPVSEAVRMEIGLSSEALNASTTLVTAMTAVLRGGYTQ